jgi:hypothetical protein
LGGMVNTGTAVRTLYIRNCDGTQVVQVVVVAIGVVQRFIDRDAVPHPYP